ncbi:helix-turn-helix domain-containing protein [Desulfoscipio gibsoniae]|uniref:DNA-binding domain-containing protein, AraC-type n=1 Tax=Desulfoscipio gibsoniae DSM 7213 TaxID=767817 RepID=R4K9H4_9FIRM|nr:helix-turn-helix domain-containing protein [Desulfoscipio gibsoniae]AGK99817.1 DNA-binding domain-containing protein, AraC-type [Desulfoscipio gibsoniae DSM 7213]
MKYIEIVDDAIHYIESNLHRKLSLRDLAFRYYVSPSYFYRIFRAVTNQTVKSYILGRKLSAAAIALRRTDRKVIDIAFQYGFNSHEQFARNFIQIFHVTPSGYRKEKTSVSLMDRMDIVERDFKNENKDIIVDYSCREVKEIKLLGKEVLLNSYYSCELVEKYRMIFDFAEEYIGRGSARRLFNVVRGDRSDPSRIYCFYGTTVEEHLGDRFGLAERTIPASRYAMFKYPEKIGLVFRTVNKDLNKWLSVTKLEINNMAGIGYFTEDYGPTRNSYLYVPVL